MTCKANERVALNTKSTKKFFEEHGIIAMKADKTQPNPAIDKILLELGNNSKGIPYYAIFPGDGSDPVAWDGLLNEGLVRNKFELAGVTTADPEIQPVSTQANQQEN